MPDPGFGIYVHWPFCQAKCPYCDFNSHVRDRVDQNDWVLAYEAEIRRLGALTSDRIVRSVFFGGGTPSLMSEGTVERILTAISQTWRFENDVEITLEANPTSVEANRFQGFRRAGVNRVSIGVQALNDADLKALGRLHSAHEALAAVDIARSTFDRISFDLMYARQHQSIADWTAELTSALALNPDHLSLYQLTIEDGTAFGDRYARGRLSGLPNEDLGADLWEVTQNLCNAAGLPAYEVSNHAKNGSESRHNLIYWRSGDWLGIGPGAHGRLTIDGLRYETASEKHPEAWLKAVREIGSGDIVSNVLSAQEVTEERLLMGLRLSEGIEMSTSWLEEKSIEIRYLKEVGLLQMDGNVLKATASGRPVLNSLIARLLTG